MSTDRPDAPRAPRARPASGRVPFFSSLYGRISLIFLLLLVLLAVAQMLAAFRSSMGFVRETDQTLNRELASDLAAAFEPHLADSLDYDALAHLIHDLMVINPHVEIYVLNEQGELRAYFTEQSNLELMQVDTAPIERFLAGGRLPIRGEDPRGSGRLKPFSAARVTIGGEGPGYLYVILGGEKYDSASAMIRESFIFRTSAVGIGLAFGATAVVGLILFAFLTRRFRNLTIVVERFAAGDRARRARIDAGDEIGRLGQAFNQMADTIDRQVQTLEETDRLRRELIANVSHDLRNPLASMQGYIETVLVKDERLSPEDRRRYLEALLGTTGRLSKLVGELFELSKLDARQTQPRREPFSIAELVQDVAVSYRPRAEEKGVTLETSLDGGMPIVVADIGMIERVISNLIENAIRYTESGGTVTIDIAEDGDTVIVNVSDTGCGIPPEDMPHVFDRFYRVEKSRSRTSGGAGLGLAIAKKILDAHESVITVRSELERGTTFAFRLPVHRPV